MHAFDNDLITVNLQEIVIKKYWNSVQECPAMSSYQEYITKETVDTSSFLMEPSPMFFSF